MTAASAAAQFAASVRRIAPLAWPVLIGQLAVLAFATVDTVLVARLSPIDLAALAVGSAVFVTVFLGFMGVVLGVGPVAGQLFGAGRLEEADFLKILGAAEVISRDELSAPGKPLAKERWAGVVDAVGSHTLVNACAATRYGGTVAACGLAQGMDFPGSVAPFILRGITLCGIDSVMAPFAVRTAAWARLAQDLDLAKLESITREIPLAQAVQAGADILAGRVRGRLVVNVNA